MIGAKTGRADLIRVDPRPLPADEPAVLLADTARLARIGWKPCFDLDSGLDDAIAWWRRHLNDLTARREAHRHTECRHSCEPTRYIFTDAATGIAPDGRAGLLWVKSGHLNTVWNCGARDPWLRPQQFAQRMP